MVLHENDTVRDIRNRFREKYSHLDIKFYTKSHESFQGSSVADEVPETLQLSKIGSSVHEGDIDVSPDITVSELEEVFEKEYGLHVQIFRKSGDTWLQTSVTDHWPLQRHQDSASAMEKYASK